MRRVTSVCLAPAPAIFTFKKGIDAMKMRLFKDVSVTDIAAIRSAVMLGFSLAVVDGKDGSAAPVKKRRVFRKRLRGPAPKAAKQQRDKEILQLRQNGWPYSRIGKRYGISAPRCAQIVTRERTAAKKAVKA